MYSKVTHNIVEEHFHHPQLAAAAAGGNIKQSGAHPNMPLPKAPMASPIDQSLNFNSPLPYYVMTEPTMLFRMDSRTLWSKYMWGLLNYGIALNAGLGDVENIKLRLAKYAADLGDMISPYYGITAGNEFTVRLTDIINNGAAIVQAVKAGQPIDQLVASWQIPVNDLCKFLHELNPNNWPQALLNDTFTALTTFWVHSIQARARNDVIADNLAVDQLSKLVITGVVNSSPTHKATSLADIFSRGIIAQFPGLFS